MPGEQARAVVVGEREVVVLGQEARRRGRVRVGQQPVRDVEQLAAALVAERPQPGPQPVDHRAQPGEPGPGADVGDRRRPEGREVAQHEPVHRRVGVERRAEERLRERPARLARLPPQPARRHLHERAAERDRLGERLRVGLRPARGELGDELRAGARSRAEQRAARGGDVVGVHARQRTGELAPERAVEHRLRDRLDGEAVGGGVQVDRRPQRLRPHRRARRDQLAQRRGPEVAQPRPERHVRVRRHLRLHPHEPLEHRRHGGRAALEQPLAREERAVQRALAEGRLRHRRRDPTAFSAGGQRLSRPTSPAPSPRPCSPCWARRTRAPRSPPGRPRGSASSARGSGPRPTGPARPRRRRA